MADFGQKLIFEESVSAVTATPSVNIGAVRREGASEYIYVYNASSNEDIARGRGAKIASQSTSYSVDVAGIAPSTLSADVCIGVCQHASIPTGQYGWLLKKGYAARMHNKLSAVVTGEFCLMTTSGTFQRPTQTSDSYWCLEAKVGRVIVGGLDTSATNTFDAWIDCGLA